MAMQPQPHPQQPHPAPAPAPAPPKIGKKIAQIATLSLGNGVVLALCDDGTLWSASPLTAQWTQVDVSAIDGSPPVVILGPFTPPATAGGVGAASPTMR